MAYEDIAALMVDREFLARLGAAIAEQSKTHDDVVSDRALRSPQEGATMFAPFVSVEPGFGDAYADAGQESITDSQLLSAIQANWDSVVNLYTS